MYSEALSIKALVGVFLALLVLAGVPVSAQTPAAVHRGLESAIASAAPDWSPDPPPRTQFGNNYQRVWRKPGNERLVLSYSLSDTADAALNQFHQNMMKISVGGLVDQRGIGDEAYLLSKYTPDGQSNLYFRRGRVLIIISATDEDLIRRTAHRIVHELDVATARK